MDIFNKDTHKFMYSCSGHASIPLNGAAAEIPDHLSKVERRFLEYDPVAKTVYDSRSNAEILTDTQLDTEKRIKTSRDTAIGQPITSSALGADHIYSTQPENRNFLNNLITLGDGGKFTCTDADGVKARRLHTHTQLLTLANDIEAHISAQFDHYEAKLAEISAATTLADLDAIIW